MKKTLQLTLGLVLMSSLMFAQSKADYSIFKTNINSLINDWVDPTENNNYEESSTWLPELGIRGKYYANRKTLSILKIADVVGVPLFVSGPHKKKMNYSSQDDFGHYNPAFLKRTLKLLTKTLKDKQFIKNAQPLYNNVFKSYVRCYWNSYRKVILDKAIKTEFISNYLSLMEEGRDAGFEIQQAFSDIAAEAEANGLDWYEYTVTATFWLRRAIDGTDEEFYNLLKLVMSKFDKEYM